MFNSTFTVWKFTRKNGIDFDSVYVEIAKPDQIGCCVAAENDAEYSHALKLTLSLSNYFLPPSFSQCYEVIWG